MQMAKSRYLVVREFDAWRLGDRHDATKRLPVIPGPKKWVYADLEIPGPIIVFEIDAIEFEVGRATFESSTRPPKPEPNSVLGVVHVRFVSFEGDRFHPVGLRNSIRPNLQ